MPKRNSSGARKPRKKAAATLFDAAVLGATPGGCAAAWHLASNGLRIVLIDAPAKPCESPLADWAPAYLFKLPGLPKGMADSCNATPFTRLCYHNAGLDKQAEHRGRGPLGYLLQAGALRDALLTACRKAGTAIRSSDAAPQLSIEEDFVRLIGPDMPSARFLIIAQGRPDDALAELSMSAQTAYASPMIVAGLDVPLSPRAAGGKGLGQTLHVVETSHRGELGVYFTSGSTLHVRLVSSSPASGMRVAELSALLGAAQRRGLLPVDLPVARAKGAVWRPPAGVALEMESHVAKRCLLAGVAGGFADSMTGQTAYPTIRSTLLAAQAVLTACKDGDPHEALARFKTTWRDALADYLRQPTTVLMLLPLLFANRQIVPRFTRALLHGQGIY